MAKDLARKAAAKQHVETGSGVILVEVESKSGQVIHARMLKSTGNRTLDNAAVRSFLKQRFKPGTARRLQIPISYRMKIDQ